MTGKPVVATVEHSGERKSAWRPSMLWRWLAIGAFCASCSLVKFGTLESVEIELTAILWALFSIAEAIVESASAMQSRVLPVQSKQGPQAIQSSGGVCEP